jgi:beta-lactamase superfamily II metal-dependent hydrolase
MADFIEVDFLGVETAKSGDAIAIRYSIGAHTWVHVVDGGYLDTGEQLVKHLAQFYSTAYVDNVVLTHPDADHANGLRKVLEGCTVGALWMNRPWLYADEIIHRFANYNSVEALQRKLKETYHATATLEALAMEKGVPIHPAFQGARIGHFTVMTPSKERYLDLIVESDRTPEAVKERSSLGLGAMFDHAFRAVTNLVKAAWGEEYFPTDGTSAENEMSIVQFIEVNGYRVLLTGDTGRDGLTEAANYAPYLGLQLPGIWAFQVPHHGGRHNVNTEVLDRWLGERLPFLPESTTWNAICSSAKADEDHPRNSVVRAMLHRGAHFSATEGKNVRIANGIAREGWTSIPQTAYPETQED